MFSTWGYDSIKQNLRLYIAENLLKVESIILDNWHDKYTLGKYISHYEFSYYYTKNLGSTW